VLRYIAENNLREGDKLPSDRQLTAMANCSLQPVTRAMQELARKGLIRRRAGAASTVLSQQPLIDDHEFSFRHSATHTYGQKLDNRILELRLRLPNSREANRQEQRARQFLGLGKDEPFYVIARLRMLDGEPRAIHISYANPRHFPESFLTDHDFERESLIRVFNLNGYRIEARKTILRARFPMEEELALLGIGFVPVLEAEQEIEACRVKTGEVVRLEFMRACYVNWEYHIASRRHPGKGENHE